MDKNKSVVIAGLGREMGGDGRGIEGIKGDREKLN